MAGFSGYWGHRSCIVRARAPAGFVLLCARTPLMFNIEPTVRHLRSLRPTRPGAAGKRSKRQRTSAFEFLEERCCPSTLDVWSGAGGNNLYSNAANWRLGVVPNNGAIYNGQSTTFDVEIPAGSAVT